MTRWLHPPELDRQAQRDRFDPVLEGGRHGLSRERSLALWERVCAAATDGAGRPDEADARRRFHELAARGGQRQPEAGRRTRVELELDGDAAHDRREVEPATRTPGRATLVATEARRWAQQSGSWLEQGAPGRLPAATLDRMERAFGQRFDDVELHVDSADVPAGQQAFAQGRHIYLGRGAVELETEHGQHVVAHELAHVVQQSRATSHGPVAPRAELEADAHQAALSALSNRAAAVRYSAPATAMLGFSSGHADDEPGAMIGPEIRAGRGTTAELRAELKRLVDEQSRYHHSTIEPEREAVYNKYTTSISRLRMLLAEREDSTLPDSTVGLTFDGKALTMAGSSAGAWPAVSGRPDAAGKFDYSAARQHQQNTGPIPEGEYWIDPRQMIDLQSRWFYTLRYKEPWGTHRITIHPFDSTQTFGRGGFFIHGGGTAGSAGCIDLTQQMADFAHRLAAIPPGTKVKITVSYAGSGLPATVAEDIAKVKQAIDASMWDVALKTLDGRTQLHEIVSILSALEASGHLDKLAANAASASPRVASAIDTAKNHKVDSAKVAADASDTDKLDLEAFGDLRRWPELLPHANRDKKQQITIKKGKEATETTAAVQNSADVPAVAKPALDAKQKAMVAYIATHREQLPDLLSEKHGGAKLPGPNPRYGIGYAYLGKDPSRLTEVKTGGTDRAALQKKWVWEEVGSEGGASSVQTYDDKSVTLGKGFAAGGQLESMLSMLFTKDPAVKDMFLDAGLTIDKGKWQMVNTDLGAIEDGKNALHLFEVNPRLLGIFVTMAEDPKHAQTNLDMQWEQLKQGAGTFPDYAKAWDELPTKLCLHLRHWLPAYAWVNNDYSATQGDTLAIVKRFGSIMVTKEGTKQKSGALLVDGGGNNWDVRYHLETLAKGSGFTALSGAATLETITKEQLDTETKYDGKLLFKASKAGKDQKDQYYVVAE